jgi:hypothetical protein
MSTTHNTLLPLAPTARLLGVPATWLRGEAEAGRIPHLKAGGALLFDVDLVEQLLLERARRPAAGKEADRA